MRISTLVVAAAIVIATIMGSVTPASAQGCILIRQTAPMFGVRWSHDGRRLLVLEDRTVVAVPVDTRTGVPVFGASVRDDN